MTVEKLADAANRLTIVLQDTLWIVISPAKKIANAHAEAYADRLKIKNKFEIEKNNPDV